MHWHLIGFRDMIDMAGKFPREIYLLYYYRRILYAELSAVT